MMTVCDPYYDPCRVTAWAERERDPLEIGKCGERRRVLPPVGRKRVSGDTRRPGLN